MILEPSQRPVGRRVCAVCHLSRLFVTAIWFIALLLVAVSEAHAAEQVRTLKVDLVPLINAAAADSSRFAVAITHSISSDKDGEWTESGNLARWHYSVRVPTAVSLSFHGESIRLPTGARLSVINGATRFVYSNAQIIRGQLWSRILKVDSLTLELTVPLSVRASAKVDIAELQVGYRGLGRGVPNHPHYDRIMRQRGGLQRFEGEVTATGTGPNSSCIVNYQCQATPDNSGPAKASVALIVSNQYQCSGTLINNARGDGIPYVITARHCESGDPASAQSAAAVTIYWNAVSPCGSLLGDLYDPALVSQSGATTVVEQQDIWLLRLAYSPVIPSPYFSGLNATGDPIQGGYSTHYAASTKEQFTEWFGQAVEVLLSGPELGVGFQSNYLGVSSQLGYFGPGASGSALFDQDGLLAGVASRGRETGGGPGNCPASPPIAPTATTAMAYFTSLARTWRSAADVTSTTGQKTLASVLDPDNSGLVTIPGASGLAALTLKANIGFVLVNSSVQLQWDAGNATSCTASGGNSGDGWAGSRPTVGTAMVTSATAATTTYTIDCTYPSGRTDRSNVDVTYNPPQPIARFVGFSRSIVWVGAPLALSWESTTGPCSISSIVPFASGGPALTNLPASGSISLVFAQANMSGSIELRCGPTANPAITGRTLQVIDPAVDYFVNSTDRKLGEYLRIVWHSDGDYCTPSGGAPNDGWTSVQRPPDSSYSVLATNSGSFTYSLTCVSGGASIQKSIVANFSDAAAYATVQIQPAVVVYGMPYKIFVKSNLDDCHMHGIPGLDSSADYTSPEATLASYAVNPPGTYQIQMTCSSNGLTVTSEPASLQIIPVPPPPPDPTVALTTTSNLPQAGQPITLSWSSANANSCSASGDSLFSGSIPTSGTKTISLSAVGAYVLSVVCQGAAATGSAHQNITVLAATGPANPSPGPSASSGGGSTGIPALIALSGLALLRARRRFLALSGTTRA